MKAIAIVGAGIGGLTAAHALRKAGIAVQIFERAPALRACGSGITMQANAMQALASLGLEKAVRDVGAEIRRGRIATWKGKTLQEIDFEIMDKQIGHRGVAVHRRRLVNVLAAGLEEHLEFGAGVRDVEPVDGGVQLAFEDGPPREFAAVLGCDGLHSVVRRALLGSKPLRYAGYTTWRGVASMAGAGIDTVEMWGAGQRFGLVPIADDEVYWFAVKEAPRDTALEGAVLARLKNLFAGWDSLVAQVLNATEEEAVIATDCLDRPPVSTWGRGRITLLGDAAHPMMPNLGQGGCQAVESAVVLGRVLAQTDDIQAGFRQYERLRKERANLFVKRSFSAGRLSQWKNPLARGIRNLGVRLMPASMAQKALVEQYDFQGWFRDQTRELSRSPG